MLLILRSKFWCVNTEYFTHCFSTANANCCRLFSDIITVLCNNDMKPANVTVGNCVSAECRSCKLLRDSNQSVKLWHCFRFEVKPTLLVLGSWCAKWHRSSVAQFLLFLSIIMILPLLHFHLSPFDILDQRAHCDISGLKVRSFYLCLCNKKDWPLVDTLLVEHVETLASTAALTQSFMQSTSWITSPDPVNPTFLPCYSK